MSKIYAIASYTKHVTDSQHLHGTRVDDTPGFNFITEKHAERLANANVRRGDVVLTHRGTIGQVAYIPQNSQYERYLVSQSQFYLRCDRTKAIPEYVVSYLGSPEGRHQLLANTSQVGVPSIAQPVTYLRTIRIPLPPLSEQHAVAHILGTLDDKIELNLRMNETLETMARALFKSWFEDFEPVRAKMEGRWLRGDSLPGLPAEHYDLFPDQLVDSELGKIPEGWEVKTLGAICTAPQYGYTASALSNPLGPKFLRITDINKLPWIEWHAVPFCQATNRDLEKYQVHTGDILIARMADPGHGVMIEGNNHIAVFASYLIRFRPLKGYFARMLQYWIRSNVYWDLVKARGSGTTRISLNAKVLQSFPLVLPPNTVAWVFSNIIGSIRDLVISNVSESSELTTLRNALMPKLVSGEVRAREVQP